jgi:hypothetical protein
VSGLCDAALPLDHPFSLPPIPVAAVGANVLRHAAPAPPGLLAFYAYSCPYTVVVYNGEQLLLNSALSRMSFFLRGCCRVASCHVFNILSDGDRCHFHRRPTQMR